MSLIQILWKESVNLHIDNIIPNNRITAIQLSNKLFNNTRNSIYILLFYWTNNLKKAIFSYKLSVYNRLYITIAELTGIVI